jgi:hypothetical protein
MAEASVRLGFVASARSSGGGCRGLDACKDAEWERQADKARAEREKGRYLRRIGAAGLPVFGGGGGDGTHIITQDNHRPTWNLRLRCPSSSLLCCIFSVGFLSTGVRLPWSPFALPLTSQRCFARPLTGTWISRLFRQIPSDTRTTIISTKVLTFYRDQSSEIWASCVGPTSLPSGVRREDELPRIFL